ncbi:hypothetical protein LTR10_017749 [Elasticomyces elasticus]|uniref:Zn(2)-C6 fungal-type domain-containing protein n=1 Tax=Exophiala sideris TaxID=1016849 RepID=A0ABR0JCC8_9EURO|nr:hypothetical protein LTR10_017749 [Elasticomyces elasticus]KAK5031257.1 hypothetical protein LTS07_004992 [Exophiala sideris]KAK5038977.1 hypothetical protein LTR13_004008 [Exophiala sideris]KAK5060862.1 hypothetical protein LTR69_005461 [Exophiala sideris]KAK5183773.1 hypothetical protein LTR44_004055 [Eurotiomycetes sp. CCFEE 6388]
MAENGFLEGNSPTSSSPSSTGAGKRKAGEDHDRMKRGKYIATACNECKRRKIKCTGEVPCRRCRHMSLECLYRPRPVTAAAQDHREIKAVHDHMGKLQIQVNALKSQLSKLQNQQTASPTISTSLPTSTPQTTWPGGSSRALSSKTLPAFRGSTTSNYCFDIVKLSLQAKGIIDMAIDYRQPEPLEAPQTTPPDITFEVDPLCLVDRQEARRLLTIYEEECHLTYPVFDLDELRNHADMLYSFTLPILRHGSPGCDAVTKSMMTDDQTTLLKIVLACRMILDGHGRSELGQRMYSSVKQAVDSVMSLPLTTTSVALLVVFATFHFWNNEETQAWRLIGLAARVSFEMGLHRSDILARSFTNETEMKTAIRVFWVVYALDRRFSFGTGMPFAIQDSDVDPALPAPDNEFPYLPHITKYNQIMTEIWAHVSALESGKLPCKDNVDFLDYQVLRWYTQLPSSLGFDDYDLMSENAIPSRGLRRLRLIMRLRKNQARISIYRVMLHSANRAVADQKCAETVTTIAKDTINIITSVNKISDLYRSQQVCYNYFLVQAVASLMLAAVRVPVVFNHDARSGLHAAIDLIESMKTQSSSSKRLLQTIRDWKFFESKISLLVSGSDIGRGSDRSKTMRRPDTFPEHDELDHSKAKYGADIVSNEQNPPNYNEACSYIQPSNNWHIPREAQALNSAPQGTPDDTLDFSTFATIFPSEPDFQRFMDELF